jgi:type I restriction enzyme R subunit
VKKRNYFAKYGEKARRVLEALLDKYADEGIEVVEEPQILTINPFTEMGTAMELVKAFGGKQAYEQAIRELERELYRA